MMPDVIIKGMEMPENCEKCDLRVNRSSTNIHDFVCVVTRGLTFYCSKSEASKKHQIPEEYLWHCPLRPATDGSGRLTPQKPQRNTRYGMGDVYHDYLCPGCSRLLAYEPAAAQHYAEKYCWSC